MIVPIRCVVDDGTVPPPGAVAAVPEAQRIEIPRADHAVFKLEFVSRSGAAYDLTGGSVAVAFTVGRAIGDRTFLFTRPAAIGSPATAGKAEVGLVPADTLSLVENQTYTYDVQLVDAAGRRWQVVPLSQLHILPIIGQP